MNNKNKTIKYEKRFYVREGDCEHTQLPVYSSINLRNSWRDATA